MSQDGDGLQLEKKGQLFFSRYKQIKFLVQNLTSDRSFPLLLVFKEVYYPQVKAIGNYCICKHLAWKQQKYHDIAPLNNKMNFILQYLDISAESSLFLAYLSSTSGCLSISWRVKESWFEVVSWPVKSMFDLSQV